MCVEIADRHVERYLTIQDDLLPRACDPSSPRGAVSDLRLARLVEFGQHANPLRACTSRQRCAIIYTVGGRAYVPRIACIGKRQVVTGKAMRPLTPREIATLLGCSERTYWRELQAARVAVLEVMAS